MFFLVFLRSKRLVSLFKSNGEAHCKSSGIDHFDKLQ